MKFELQKYHGNVSDEDLIEDIRKTAEKLSKRTLTGAEYDKYGTFHSSTLTRRFGSWKLVLEKSGLETKGHNFKSVFKGKPLLVRLSLALLVKLRVANLLPNGILPTKSG